MRSQLLSCAVVLSLAASNALSQPQPRPGQTDAACVPGPAPQQDRSRPVPSKADVIKAWQTREAAIRNFRFTWTEDQTHARAWMPNPRYPERERLAAPVLLADRRHVVTKSLLVADNRMRYSFEFDRRTDPDAGVRPSGNWQHFSYSYVSVFDGRRGTVRLTSLMASPPSTTLETTANIDAQNLDLRPILMTFRPLDPVMGHLLMDRAVPNFSRTFYQGRSVFLLEERRDPAGWKTILWIEPERDFLVSRYALVYEETCMVSIDIDYRHEPQWGWIPSAWRETALLSDGSRRLLTTARITAYTINGTVGQGEFR